MSLRYHNRRRKQAKERVLGIILGIIIAWFLIISIVTGSVLLIMKLVAG